MTGFGRTGKLFASHYLTEKPDLMCLSKGLTGGTMALGVTTCTAALYDAFLSDDRMKTLFHGHSFTANPLACTAALASLDLLLTPECTANNHRISQSHAAFAAVLRGHPGVGQVRQRGTILAFDLVSNGQTQVAARSYFNSIRDVAYVFLLERDILMRPLGNVLYLMPPYCTTNAQLTLAHNAVLALLSRLA